MNIRIRWLVLLAALCWACGTQDTSAQTNRAPQAPGKPRIVTSEAPAKSQAQRPLPFRGTIKSVDKTARTFLIGTRTFAVTPKSKLTEGGKPVELSEKLVGQWVTGSYMRTGEAKLPIISMYVGGKKASAEVPKPKSATK